MKMVMLVWDLLCAIAFGLAVDLFLITHDHLGADSN
jgi:hypothetical protein